LRFVLDASLTLAWCFADEQTRFTDAALAAVPIVGAAVPTIWIYEVANGLRTAQRAGRLTEDAVAEFVDRLGLLPIDTVAMTAETMLGEVRLLALGQDLTVYDASYLILARRLAMPLGTLDGSGKRHGLKQAAARSGVPLLSIEHVDAWTRERRHEPEE
jgi:predicted nucleic acid-binding protein